MRTVAGRWKEVRRPPWAAGGAGWKPPLAANRLRRSPQPSGVIEGITYFDHPANPNHPAKWHVREDGWMGASVCMDEPISTSGLHPLTLRYLLHAHGGPIDATRANAIAKEFAQRPGFVVAKATARHRQFTARRSSAPGQ
jgi:hypothetical protein